MRDTKGQKRKRGGDGCALGQRRGEIKEIKRQKDGDRGDRETEEWEGRHKRKSGMGYRKRKKQVAWY